MCQGLTLYKMYIDLYQHSVYYYSNSINHMDSFTRPDRDLNKELKDFIDYVFSFYGDVDPVYPMRKVIGDTPLNKSDILDATYDYLSTISKRNSETYTWGEGDSLDRERVRDILLNDYDFYLVHLQHGNV